MIYYFFLSPDTTIDGGSGCPPLVDSLGSHLVSNYELQVVNNSGRFNFKEAQKVLGLCLGCMLDERGDGVQDPNPFLSGAHAYSDT